MPNVGYIGGDVTLAEKAKLVEQHLSWRSEFAVDGGLRAQCRCGETRWLNWRGRWYCVNCGRWVRYWPVEVREKLESAVKLQKKLNKTRPPRKHVRVGRSKVEQLSPTVLRYTHPCGHTSDDDLSACPDHLDEIAIARFARYWGNSGVNADCPTCKSYMKTRGIRFVTTNRERRKRSCVRCANGRRRKK